MFTVVANTILAILFLIATMLVYKTQAPWTNAGIRSMIWTVYGLAVLLTVVVPLALERIFNMSPIILCVLVFPYLFWVSGHGKASGETGPAAQNHQNMKK